MTLTASCDRCGGVYPEDPHHPGYAALHSCMPVDLAAVAEPTHRFVEWNVGDHYAFARGLSVSPQHLPRTLDEMLGLGWELQAIFGETRADKIGFIFRRT